MTSTRLHIQCRRALFLGTVVALAACSNSSTTGKTGGVAAGGTHTGGTTASAGGSMAGSAGVASSGGATTAGGSTASGGSMGGATTSGGITGLPNTSAVLEAMQRANTWFMNKHPDPTADIVTDKTRPSNLWTRAAYYEGLMALYKVEPDAAKKLNYYTYAVNWGSSPTHPWTLANTKAGVLSNDANNQACGQTYIDLYNIDPQPIRIQEIKANIDDMVAKGTSNVWWWIDAIQMSMPVFARLGVLENDTKYFDAMWALYNDSRMNEGGGLFNSDVGFWWRDLHYTPSLPSAVADAGTVGSADSGSAVSTDARIDAAANAAIDAAAADAAMADAGDSGAAFSVDYTVKQTITLSLSQNLPAQTQDAYIVAPNGKSIYWARGNGWILAALVRVLDILPTTDPHRSTYVSDFQAMASALVPLQRSDGFWNESLFDPNHCASIGLTGDDGPETSGTVFFVYGLAWGIRKGLLDPATYGPVLQKAWNGLSTLALQSDGLLGYVQSTGALPCTEDPQHPGRLGATTLANFDDYGVGGFLLAGSEVYQLVGGVVTPNVGAGTGTGGTTGTSGTSGTGGMTAGGTTSAGGSTSTSGTSSAGGSTATGGTTGAGGTTDTGGTTGAGGSTSTGGTTNAGGSTGAGETSTTGGTTSTGGTGATGGVTSGGGNKATGGSKASSGTKT
jgi:rhamnogalacturonyl hydrolase YesR